VSGVVVALVHGWGSLVSGDALYASDFLSDKVSVVAVFAEVCHEFVVLKVNVSSLEQSLRTKLKGMARLVCL